MHFTPGVPGSYIETTVVRQVRMQTLGASASVNKATFFTRRLPGQSCDPRSKGVENDPMITLALGLSHLPAGPGIYHKAR